MAANSRRVLAAKDQKNFVDNDITPQNVFDKTLDFSMYALEVLTNFDEQTHGSSDNADNLFIELESLSKNIPKYSGYIQRFISSNHVDRKESKAIDLMILSVAYKLDYLYIKIAMIKEKNSIRKILSEHGVGQSSTDIAGDHHPELRSFAERLDHYRRAAGLTQRELAERAELTRSNVSNLEAGRWEPRLNTILKLAETLNIDPCALLPRQPPRQR